MKVHTLEQEQRMPVSVEEAWEFFSSPRNLDAITPPDVGFRILRQAGEKMYDGQIIIYEIKVPPGIWVNWVTEIRAVKQGESFIDEQHSGPYKFWHHRHTFEKIEGGVLMRDEVNYALPFWPFSEIVHELYVKNKLREIFQYRKDVLARRFGTLD